MSDQEAFDRGLASSPRKDATRIPQDAASHLNGMPLLDNRGNQVEDAAGVDAQTPKAFSPEFFYQRGLANASLCADAIRDWEDLYQLEPFSKITPMTMAELTAARLMLGGRMKLQDLPVTRFGQQAD